MTCNDCIHNEVCYGTHTDDSPTCCDFKDKSRFIELPCKVGSTFYVPYDSGIEEYECLGFVYLDEKISLITTYTMTFLFNEEAFLTREEAEKASKVR